MRECDSRGREVFLSTHHYGQADQYYVQHDGRLYDAKAIAGVAYGYQFRRQGTPSHDEFSGGEAGANAVLRGLGFEVVDRKPSTVDGERVWRLAVQAHLQATAGDASLEPKTLRSLGVYGGAQGVWVDSRRTQKLDSRGITVGLLHTGLHYADDFTDKDVLYHYPRTNRQPGRDRSEIEATKAAGQLRIPVFVISHPAPRSPRRKVQLGWVEGWDDDSELFLITFRWQAPTDLLDTDRSDEEDFNLRGAGHRRKMRSVSERSGQSQFKLKVLQRYGPRCPLSGVAVSAMLDAAHLVPHAEDGSDDPRNGIPLNAALHRAFDAHLFAIDPESHKVVTRATGPSLDELGITTPTLEHLPKLPHPDALRWRYKDWLRRQSNQ
ncbi:hypothetical protein GCM10027521_14300 [Amycolatopsis cihanbeyliensis]